ncbi:hypothetical protein [Trinickia diaoshuihuensis]|jgi:intracellular multiplication protein IcmJ|uniref:hypothetical protein n=1 Tax=Trinickia diaoshuihuensis TaxID=2292265 RepID=UPI000E27A272|nr:hypothetical protein [Trinickia diaoshuihuensis]
MNETNDDEFGMLAVPLVSGVRHLDEVGQAKHGVLIDSGSLPQAEINHLQRTIAVVLQCGDEAQRAEAHALLQHLASRSELVVGTWGSANPSDFARALRAAAQQPGVASAALALLYRPARFSRKIKQWLDAHYRQLPLEAWKEVYARVSGHTVR